MDKDATIFLAGHTGLAGSALLRRMISDGYTNVVTRTHDQLDLTDQAATEAFFHAEKPEYVLLAAGKVGGIYANAQYPAEFIHTNLAIQTHVLHCSRIIGVRRLLFLGSSCIYPKHPAQPIGEDQLLTGPLEPTNASYAVAKIAGIQSCWAHNQQFGTRFIPVMPTNLYGQGDNFDLNDAHVLPAMIRKFHLAALAGEGNREAIEADIRRFGPIPDDIRTSLGLDASPRTRPSVVLWGTGTPRREFLFSDDLADACLMVMNTPFDTLCQHGGAADRMLFNIGTGKDQSIKKLSEITADVIGYRGAVSWNSDMPDGTPRKRLNVERMRAMGWTAETGLTEGIRQTYDWYLSRR